MIQSKRCICDKMTPSVLPDTVVRVPNRGAKLTWHGVGCVAAFYIAIYTSILQNVLADLPIHATTSDIRGLWLFSLTPPVHGAVQSCGSTTPNKNSTNLRPELQDFKSFLETHGEMEWWECEQAAWADICRQGGVERGRVVTGTYSFHDRTQSYPKMAAGRICGILSDIHRYTVSASVCAYYAGVHKQIRLLLADKPVPFSVTRKDAAATGLNRQSWKALGVFDGEKPDALVGSWTAVYDEGMIPRAESEVVSDRTTGRRVAYSFSKWACVKLVRTGFEVNVGDHTRLMGFMKYSMDPICNAPPRDGDLEDSSGNTRCYITDARRTHMGWYNQDKDEGGFVSGCFYAERLDGPPERAATAFVLVQEAQTPESASFLSTTQATASSSGPRQQQTPVDLAYYVSQDFIDSHNASPTSTWRAGLNPVFAHMNGAALSKYIKNFGVKKFYRQNSGKFQAAHSFMQSGTSSVSEDSSASQLYACPCKKGERPLDTRTEASGASVPVLSPVSALEFGDQKTFLAPIAPHGDSAALSPGKKENPYNPSSKSPVEALVHLHPATGAGGEELDRYQMPLASLEISAGDLPANFSWSDPFSGAAIDEDVINQGSCGSCYAVAATYALQKRFEIAASKMLGREVKLFGQPSENSKVLYGDHATSFVDLRDAIGAHGGLSAQSVLSCSFYNQGCDGGFPYLVGKHAREIGIPQENCMRYQATDKTACALHSSSPSVDGEKSPLFSPAESLVETESQACVSNARWFARDYGYVGSCYECNQCSGESMIMEEVHRNGPVAVALEAPEALFSYSSGIFDVDPSRHHHSRVCDVNSADCSGLLTGWEFTNHAVALVGWGEEPVEGGSTAEAKKYWIVRNTWGPSWGKNGYVKIARGKNLGGIESQATWIDPDFTRGMGREVAQRIEALKRTADVSL